MIVSKEEWYPVAELWERPYWHKREHGLWLKFLPVVEASYEDWIDTQLARNVFEANQGRLFELYRAAGGE
jgi:hypothetical protein